MNLTNNEIVSKKKRMSIRLCQVSLEVSNMTCEIYEFVQLQSPNKPHNVIEQTVISAVIGKCYINSCLDFQKNKFARNKIEFDFGRFKCSDELKYKIYKKLIIDNVKPLIEDINENSQEELFDLYSTISQMILQINVKHAIDSISEASDYTEETLYAIERKLSYLLFYKYKDHLQ
jgi:hypothetical protein